MTRVGLILRGVNRSGGRFFSTVKVTLKRVTLIQPQLLMSCIHPSERQVMRLLRL